MQYLISFSAFLALTFNCFPSWAQDLCPSLHTPIGPIATAGPEFGFTELEAIYGITPPVPRSQRDAEIWLTLPSNDCWVSVNFTEYPPAGEFRIIRTTIPTREPEPFYISAWRYQNGNERQYCFLKTGSQQPQYDPDLEMYYVTVSGGGAPIKVAFESPPESTETPAPSTGSATPASTVIGVVNHLNLTINQNETDSIPSTDECSAQRILHRLEAIGKAHTDFTPQPVTQNDPVTPPNSKISFRFQEQAVYATVSISDPDDVALEKVDGNAQAALKNLTILADAVPDSLATLLSNGNSRFRGDLIMVVMDDPGTFLSHPADQPITSTIATATVDVVRCKDKLKASTVGELTSLKKAVLAKKGSRSLSLIGYLRFTCPQIGTVTIAIDGPMTIVAN